MSDSERLREFIAERGMTQRELAAAVGVSAKYVQQLCTVRPVPDQFVGRLARVFGGAAAAAVAGHAEPGQGGRGAEGQRRGGAEAQGIAFPPSELYHELARPGLYETHLFDHLLFDGDVARRMSGARRRWDVDELVWGALVACGVVKGERASGRVGERGSERVAYQAPVERWYTPAGETCVAYGPDDAADGDEGAHAGAPQQESAPTGEGGSREEVA